MKLKKIISGGQTGVDQAALRAGLELGFNIGGWCPPGRECENGKIPSDYPLRETEKDRSDKAPDIPRSQRTEFNVRDSDATLMLKPQNVENDSGTECTIMFVRLYNKPFLIADPYRDDTPELIKEWLQESVPEILNIAGPGEKTSPGIYNRVYRMLILVFNSPNKKS